MKLLVALVLALAATVAANNITAYQSKVNQIFDLALADETGYSRLDYLCTQFGARITGSDNLDATIDWAVAEMKKDGFDSVTTETVAVPNWVRHYEALKMTHPREKTMAVLALGGSIGTGPSAIVADVLVVKDFTELAQRASEAKGKIVVYNAPWAGSYSATVTYRSNGAVEAAKVGAVASLTRSVTPYSLYTPHTGQMYYADGVKKIPSAAITVEDAVLLQKLQDSGSTPKLTLFLNCETLPDTPSRNIIADLKGSVYPDELVVIGGHVDSWDVGEGAHDDGGGILQTWEALRLLAAAGLRPQRTIRVVFWTSEENGGAGADTYYANHQDEIANTTFCYETDGGTFTPVGFSFAGVSAAMAQVQQIADLMAPYAHIDVTPGGAGADVTPLTNAGVPGAGLLVSGDGGTDKDKYFWYHHTNADTIDHVALSDFQQCTGTIAALAYVVADMETNLPR